MSAPALGSSGQCLPRDGLIWAAIFELIGAKLGVLGALRTVALAVIASTALVAATMLVD